MLSSSTSQSHCYQVHAGWRWVAWAGAAPGTGTRLLSGRLLPHPLLRPQWLLLLRLLLVRNKLNWSFCWARSPGVCPTRSPYTPRSLLSFSPPTPPFPGLGELYYEGKEFESVAKHARPGVLSAELQVGAVGMAAVLVRVLWAEVQSCVVLV